MCCVCMQEGGKKTKRDSRLHLQGIVTNLGLNTLVQLEFSQYGKKDKIWFGQSPVKIMCFQSFSATLNDR